MPLQATSGAASYDAFGGGVVAEPNYIESCFSTYLYTGNSSTQTITNGIDLSGKGGMTWLKSRTTAQENLLTDTTRGAGYTLVSESTGAQFLNTNIISSFTSSGFSLGGEGASNGSGKNFTSWTFRKQPKFFDIVTYTGNDVGGRTVSHNLGSAPGCMIIKRTDVGGYFWVVYHRGANGGVDPEQYYIKLNATDTLSGPNSSVWNNTAPTSTNFTLGTASAVNLSGATYIAYLFAHNAGGFGLTGTDNVISCGSFTTDGSGFSSVNLGYEPQWLLMKDTQSSTIYDNWYVIDNMRGFLVNGNATELYANKSDVENANVQRAGITSTGFIPQGLNANKTYIYIAIRRGPMKVPTSGTSVFSPNAYTGGTAGTSFNLGFVPDTLLTMRRDTSNFNILQSRLTGLQYMLTHATDAEAAGVAGTPQWDANTGTIKLATATSVTGWNASGFTYVNEVFARAPNFFDEVCYTGTGSNTTQTHNLTVAPELVIIKSRSNAIVWVVGNTAIGFGNYLLLNATDASASGSNVFNSTAPTSTVFSIGSGSGTNQSGATYVAYLFATLAGVSKVGSYTGNGSSQTINCGFTGGARFVLIKKSSGTGDWMVADSARGIVSGNDPYLELNNTNAEVTGEDWLDTDSTGFVVNEVSGSNANTSGATYIFLAIA